MTPSPEPARVAPPALTAPAGLPELATAPLATLFQDVCDLASVSGDERALADAVEAALRAAGHLAVLRDGDAIVARTTLGRAQRVLVAGHLDTVPVAGNLPTRWEERDGERVLWGRGTVDMKGGVAVALHLAATLADPRVDLTWVFYDHEEVEARLNGLGRLVRNHPDWLAADLAVLAEPTGAQLEGGCNGTLRVGVTARGRTAHSARAWLGRNAVHGLAPVLARLAAYEAGTVVVDGLAYRESLQAVGISGGIATNMVPDRATVLVNYRFAPSRSVAEALAHVREVLEVADADADADGDGLEIEVLDAAAGARPGLDHPLASSFAQAVAASTGAQVRPKYGWTDVARFTELGIPAVNFGPGDPSLAHADDEHCSLAQVEAVAAALRTWLGG